MRDCDKYKELISLMIDGELSTDEQSELQAHLDECEECRMTSDAFSDISKALSEDLAEPPVALLSGVMSRISAQSAPNRPRRFRFGYVAAMAACLALVVFSAARYGGGMFGFDSANDSSGSNAVTFGATAPEMPAADALDESIGIARAADSAEGASKNDQDVAPSEQSAAEPDPEISITAEDGAEPEPAPSDSYQSLFGESSVPLLLMTSAEIYSGEDLLLTLDNKDDLSRFSEMLSVIGPASEGTGDAEPTYSVTASFPDGSSRIVDVWVTQTLVMCVYDDELVIAAASPEELGSFIETENN